MSKPLKAAFFDVDWTLYDHSAKQYVSSGIAAIKKLQKQGTKVFICSARPYESLKNFGVFDLGIRWNGYITCAGAYAVVGNRVVRKMAMPIPLIRQLIDVTDELGLCVQLVTAKKRFLTLPSNEYAFDYDNYYHDRCLVVHPYSSEEIIGVLVFAPEEYDAIIAERVPGFHFFRFANCGVDLMDHEHRKGDAIADILKFLSIEKKDAIAFGDDVQDITMKGEVRTFVCVGNGKKEALAAADFISPRIEDDGIEKALKGLGYLD